MFEVGFPDARTGWPFSDDSTISVFCRMQSCKEDGMSAYVSVAYSPSYAKRGSTFSPNVHPIVDPSVGTESVRKNLVTEVKLRQLKRQFYTNVPSSYVKNIIDGVVPKIGVNFEEEKELYQIKLSDITRPDSTISCKCSIELNQVRHLVIDISCLDKNLDLRLMLSTKRILTSLTDDEKQSISNLISSAILDPDVKGGLRWPFGKESSGDRYSVIGVWHIKAKAYTNSSVRLRVRDADRFDFRSSAGEVAREITLKMTGLVSQLRKVEVESVSDQLKDTLKLVWDHFLSSACSFT
ncbi:hypothetical protein CK203_117509 [Vitis vinifera]|uniref:DUF7903 domain-containing protein n=1 Tax=Vitis vinifera TaxID=29760 RepID=A0A438D7E1_VITVI|nr:hypothetical protein CK203_117509 [Vitis vinifera]